MVSTWVHALLLFFFLLPAIGTWPRMGYLESLKAHFVTLPNLCPSQGLKSCVNGPKPNKLWNMQLFLNNRAAGIRQVQHPANGAADPAPARMHKAPYRKAEKETQVCQPTNPGSEGPGDVPASSQACAGFPPGCAAAITPGPTSTVGQELRLPAEGKELPLQPPLSSP